VGNNMPEVRGHSGGFMQIGAGSHDLLEAAAYTRQPASPARGPPELRRA
jgi:hypothetical protein